MFYKYLENKSFVLIFTKLLLQITIVNLHKSLQYLSTAIPYARLNQCDKHLSSELAKERIYNLILQATANKIDLPKLFYDD